MVTQLSPDRTLEDVVSDLDRVVVGDLLDSIADPVCEVHLGKTFDSPKCGAPAAWLSMASCGHTAYYCEPCRATAKAKLDKRDARPLCPLHTPFVDITIEWRALRAPAPTSATTPRSMPAC